MTTHNTYPVPDGTCWDGCGGTPAPGAFFLTGHGKRAERYLSYVDGKLTTAQRLLARGLIGSQLREAALAANPRLEECGRHKTDGTPCQVIGEGGGIRRHRADNNQHGKHCLALNTLTGMYCPVEASTGVGYCPAHANPLARDGQPWQ